MRTLTCLITLLAMTANVTAAYSQDWQEPSPLRGSGPGNGGDIDLVAAAGVFLKISESIVDDFETWAGREIPSVDTGQLRVVVRDLREGALQLIPLTRPVSGKNGRNKKGVGIAFDAKAFVRPQSQAERRAWVLHELLGLMDVEVEHYSISGRYLALLNARADEQIKHAINKLLQRQIYAARMASDFQSALAGYGEILEKSEGMAESSQRLLISGMALFVVAGGSALFAAKGAVMTNLEFAGLAGPLAAGGPVIVGGIVAENVGGPNFNTNVHLRRKDETVMGEQERMNARYLENLKIVLKSVSPAAINATTDRWIAGLAEAHDEVGQRYKRVHENGAPSRLRNVFTFGSAQVEYDRSFYLEALAQRDLYDEEVSAAGQLVNALRTLLSNHK